MTIIEELALLLVMLALSAFFAASEVAFLSISRVKLHSMLDRNVPGAERLARLRHNRRRVIIALLIGNNVVSITASALATSMAIGIFGEAGVGIAVGVMLFLILTFGEIAPKSAATTYGEKLALQLAPFIEAFCTIATPLVLFFEFINRLIPGVYSTATKIEKFTEDEVRSAVKLGAKSNSISEKERELIENVLEFNDRTVVQAMTPKSQVTFLDADMSISEAHRKAVESNFSRFPVMKNDKVVGVASVRILGWALHNRPTAKVSDVAIKPIELRQSETAAEAFDRLQALGRNIAVVYNEKGEFAGVITLEDLLEEIVGEIK